MINNFEQINNLLNFENLNDFYYLQIIQRKKDIPDLKHNNHLILSYFITSNEMFKCVFEKEIIHYCNIFNARAYINLNKRNFKNLSLNMIKKLAENVSYEQYSDIPNLIDSLCGKYHNDPIKKWIIDLDEKVDSSIIESYWKFIENLQPIGSKKIATIPTKNGVHLICTPFDLQTFKRDFPLIDVHKNNPTLLFTY